MVSNYYVYILIDSFYELPRNLLLSREYKKSKMKETNLNDIPKIVNKLNRIVYKKRKKNFVKLKKLNDDIYQLS